MIFILGWRVWVWPRVENFISSKSGTIFLHTTWKSSPCTWHIAHPRRGICLNRCSPLFSSCLQLCSRWSWLGIANRRQLHWCFCSIAVHCLSWGQWCWLCWSHSWSQLWQFRFFTHLRSSANDWPSTRLEQRCYLYPFCSGPACNVLEGWLWSAMHDTDVIPSLESGV